MHKTGLSIRIRIYLFEILSQKGALKEQCSITVVVTEVIIYFWDVKFSNGDADRQPQNRTLYKRTSQSGSLTT